MLPPVESQPCLLLMWVPFPSGHLMCQCHSLHLPDANADRFPILSASHRSINGMLKLVQYSRTWGNGRDPGTSRSQESACRMPLGVNVYQQDRVLQLWTPPPSERLISRVLMPRFFLTASIRISFRHCRKGSADTV